MSLRLFEAVMFSQNVIIFGDFSSFENTDQAVCRLSLNLSVCLMFSPWLAWEGRPAK